MTSNVPIPGGGSAGARPGRTVVKARVVSSRRWFYTAVAVLAVSALLIAFLALGEPWNLAPGMTASFAKSVASLAITFILVLPAFAVFRYERQSAGGRWHEPPWRPSLIGWVGLLVSLGLAIGWHGLRLAIYIARVWTGEL